MLTKEECENKLKNLKTLQDEIDKICTLNVVANIAFTNAIECFEDLIKEHFLNQPLEWEEIKEGDFVFDKDFNGLGGEWLKVYMKHITNYGEKILMCGACGSGVCQTRSYKEDRFYRKEVKE